MPFFRQFQHLLPRAKAWRLPVGSKIRKLFAGLSGFGADVREYADDAHDDLSPSLTRELEEWESQFGLFGDGTEANRRAALDSAWKQRGGQSPSYLQARVREAGFDVYIHEWWQTAASFSQVCCNDDLAECGEPRAQCGAGKITRFIRDPRSYTNVPLIGSTQCGEPDALCGEPTARCNRFLANEPGYLVNKLLTDEAPPPIPSDMSKWVFFHYWGASTFPNRAQVPLVRRAEFERLVLKLRPAEQWIVLLIDYV